MMKDIGVTLVALIITIIVMLILAGTSLSVLLGKDGVIEKSKFAKEESQKSTVKEIIELGILASQAEIKIKSEELTMENIIKELPNKVKNLTIIKANIEEPVGTYQLNEQESYYFKIKKNYEVIIIDEIEDTQIPEQATISLKNDKLLIGEDIVATITHKDIDSGIDISKCKWGLTNSNQEIGTDEAKYLNISSTNPETVTIETDKTGTYYLHVLSVDNYQNKIESISDAIIIEIQSYIFSYTNQMQTFTAPTTSDYLIECWGAGGGDIQTAGAYAAGKIHLQQGTNLYVYVGQQGSGSEHINADNPPTFNGGGGGGRGGNYLNGKQYVNGGSGGRSN